MLPALIVVAAVGTACIPSDGDDETSDPSTTVAAVATTAPPTTAVVTVPGTPRTTSTIAAKLDSGQARLSGTVTGDTDLAGVVVRVEHFVGDTVASAEVPTSAGSWSLDGIPGGRYRVTAFRNPDLGSVTPEVFFLAASEARNVVLTVQRATQSGITATLTPSPPPLNRPLKLSVQVGAGALDSQGRLITSPQPGVILQLASSGGLTLESQATQITDGNGTAVWNLRCTAAGTFPLSLIVDDGRTTINVPPCGG